MKCVLTDNLGIKNTVRAHKLVLMKVVSILFFIIYLFCLMELQLQICFNEFKLMVKKTEISSAPYEGYQGSI